MTVLVVILALAVVAIGAVAMRERSRQGPPARAHAAGRILFPFLGTDLSPRGLDAALRIAGDFDFWIRAAAAGARFGFVPRTVAAFRVRAGQLSGGVAQAKDEEAAVLRRRDLRIGRLDQWLAAVRFRAQNLPRILQRIGRTGRLRSRRMMAR